MLACLRYQIIAGPTNTTVGGYLARVYTRTGNAKKHVELRSV